MSEQELVQLRELRGIPKGLVTKMEKWVLKHGGTASLFDLEGKLEQLLKYETQFEKVQSDLEMKDPAERSAEATERPLFEDKVANVKAKLREYKAAFHHENLNETLGNGTINVDVVDSELPKIEIPKFSGDYLDYPQFKDTFTSVVHLSRSKGMTDIRRFALLRNSLTGKALDSIKNLPMTSENYNEALNLLDERFNRKRLIFEAFIKKLWELPRAYNTSTLRELCDAYISTQKGLELIASAEDIVTGVIIQLLLTKCDRDTIRKWEEKSADKDELPNQEEFTYFLRKRCVQLESVDYALKQSSSATKHDDKTQKSKHKYTNAIISTSSCCPLCSQSHELLDCSKFLEMTPKDKYFYVKKVNHCIRCVNLPKSHGICRELCMKCKKQHHEVLHFDNQITNAIKESKPSTSFAGNTTVGEFPKRVINPEISQDKLMKDPSLNVYTLLATACLKVQSADGTFVTLKALLDGGSQLNLITERAQKVLGLKPEKMQSSILLQGINNTKLVLQKAILVNIKSICNDFNDSIMLVVHPNLRQRHPVQEIPIEKWNIPSDIKLADPKFNAPSDIDIILNTTPTYKYLHPNQILLGNGLPLLQDTKLGYIVVGDISLNKFTPSSHAYTLTDSIVVPHTNDQLTDTIKQFWELEEVKAPVKLYSSMEKECESHFKDTYQRTSNGRFIVRLPFLKPPRVLGGSRATALRRLFSIEKKMNACPEYRDQYVNFMKEYIDLNHCTEIQPPTSSVPQYYIPHFAVFNENSTTTKTRVVFDASCNTDSGYSLNDVLMVGPKIQDDLIIHLLRFRSYAIALTGDIAKMYRQILVHPNDQLFQLIVWRHPDDNQIKTYKLNTVTYGTASAPFAAVRCLQELAVTDADDLPLAKQIVLNNFYVDDMITGSDSPETVKRMYQEIKQLLSRGQLSIHKFHSNSAEVLSSIPDIEHGSSVTIGDTAVTKTLGLNWLPKEDNFAYYYELSKEVKITKRIILSETSRLFDPLGLVQPIIVLAKIFMQKLWAAKLDWDTPLKAPECDIWLKFRSELQSVAKISVPRFITSLVKYYNLEIHGFCDSSQLAYAACIYIRSIGPSGVNVRLLISKTRVAPLKTISLPKLELCGALLLAQLYSLVQENFKLDVAKTFLWCDSAITLKWISESPHKWNSFVANRTTKIQDLTADCKWLHVPGEHNPADLASRGCWASELKNDSFWFNGPRYLYEEEDNWPKFQAPEVVDPPELKKVVNLSSTTDKDLITRCKYVTLSPILQFTVWPKLRRVFAYVNRFIHRVKTKWRSTNSVTCLSKNVEPLNLSDVNAGASLIVKVVQQIHFKAEIQALQKRQKVFDDSKIINFAPFIDGQALLPRGSKISSLAPFIDAEGLLRVGGRLENAADLSFDQKFPMLLPKEHQLTKIIFLWAHYHLLHAGPSLLLSFVRRNFWPIQGKTISNQVVHHCVRCRRLKPVTFEQIMGSLPADRVTLSSRPFVATGVDFAGPMKVHYRLRGSRPTDVYIAVFVCFSSKAVHLELVEDLTAQSFLNGLQRFVSRRGRPNKIWSDNATNFLGASNQLKEFRDFFLNPDTQDKINEWCRDENNIQWNFIPAKCPHWGGLWEAAVKSAKFHIQRVVGLTTLTYPEMTTVLTMVEAVLNNRPIIPLSTNPMDGQPLTPAHFLTGAPLQPLPEPEVTNIETNYVEKFKKVVALKHLFCQKWSKEYLHTLQNRYKWPSKQQNAQVDDLVLLVDKTPYLKWIVGKIIIVHPDPHGNVRAVTVETKFGKYKRGITEICPLPKANN